MSTPAPAATTSPLTIIGLYGENVKRLRVVNIVPPATGLVKVAGGNAQGKSSTLDAIVMALGGKDAQPELPIRQGAKHAKVVLDLGALRVTSTWTAKDTYLTVERRGEPSKLGAPQDVLNSLIGAGLGFDPLEFVERLKPAEQVATLLRLLHLPEDPRALDVTKKHAYDERTLVNREVRTLDAKLAGLLEPAEDVPDAEVSVADLAAEHARRVAQHHANDETRAARERAADAARGRRERVAQLERDLAAARTGLQEAEGHLAAADRAVGDLVDPDLTSVTMQMQDAEALNATVRQKLARQAVAAELRTKQQQASDLSDAILALEEKKRALLAAAPFPVPGLGFEEIAAGEYRVTYQGVPLQDCAASEQIRVGLAIAMALNPTVRVILLRNGSLLDAPTLAAVEATVRAAGYQLWCELVGEGDADSIVLEDGGVIRAPEGRAPAPAAPAEVSPAGVFGNGA